MTRPIGPVVVDWTDAVEPQNLSLSGQWAELTPLDVVADAPGLWAAFDGADWVWDYLYNAAHDFESFCAILADAGSDPKRPCFVIRAKGDPAPLGYACFYTVVPKMGAIEIGNVNLSPALQRTPIATEAFFLMIDWAFSNGYRRMEWKCNALNAPSRQAAQRLGYSYEGVFRQHLIVKGRNRDTAWFAMTDGDWGELRGAFLTWLSAENFDKDGQQKQSLAPLTAPHLVNLDTSLD